MKKRGGGRGGNEIGCGSKLNRRGKPQVLGNMFPLTDWVAFLVPVFGATAKWARKAPCDVPELPRFEKGVQFW